MAGIGELSSGTLVKPRKPKKAPKPLPRPQGKGPGIPGFVKNQVDYVKEQAKKKAAEDKEAADAKDAADEKADAADLAAKEANRADAMATIKLMLDQWGLGELAGTIVGYIQKDYSVNQILVELKQSEAYKKRFAGNYERVKNGYAMLDPQEYLAVEDTYQRILQAAGLPKGFYDEPSDFNQWIGLNVSAAEVQGRVDLATDAVNNSDPAYLQALSRYGFTQGDLVAQMLDQGRAEPILRKQVGSAKVGAGATRAGLHYDTARAEELYGMLADGNGGIDRQAVDSGWTSVAAALPAADRLSTIYADTGEGVGQTTLEDEFLGRNELASQRRRRLGITEYVNYQGSGGAGEKSQATKSRGEF